MMNTKTAEEKRTELNYKVYDANDNSIESDSVTVASVSDWVGSHREECAFKGWTINIWDNEGNSH